jgi:hypothetical protein
MQSGSYHSNHIQKLTEVSMTFISHLNCIYGRWLYEDHELDSNLPSAVNGKNSEELQRVYRLLFSFLASFRLFA